MKYFDLVEDITYLGDTAKNLFNKFIIDTDLDDKYITSYEITDGDSLEDVSFELYGNIDHWWILALLNNIEDTIYDIPITQDALQEMAKNLSYIDDVFSQSLYSSIYDELELENDRKRKIKTIKKEFLSKFLSDIVRSINE